MLEYSSILLLMEEATWDVNNGKLPTSTAAGCLPSTVPAMFFDVRPRRCSFDGFCLWMWNCCNPATYNTDPLATGFAQISSSLTYTLVNSKAGTWTWKYPLQAKGKTSSHTTHFRPGFQMLVFGGCTEPRCTKQDLMSSLLEVDILPQGQRSHRCTNRTAWVRQSGNDAVDHNRWDSFVVAFLFQSGTCRSICCKTCSISGWAAFLGRDLLGLVHLWPTLL